MDAARQNIGCCERTHMRLWVLLNTRFPCCRGRAIFRAIEQVPREIYQRKCPQCGQKWGIERRTTKENNQMRIDMLDWEKVPC
jgi:ssDNA-binding Zn-finger/Zn-ribbon topoisomerase 1